MILTVTPDPVLDKIIFVEKWTPDVPMHSKKMTLGVGGKGLDASLVLQQLAVETVGLAFLAGETGQALLDLAGEYNLAVEPVWAGGETRTAYIIAVIEEHRSSHIFTGGLAIDEDQCRAFVEKFEGCVPEAEWVICGGILPEVLPATFFRTITERAHAAGVPVLIDSFRAAINEALPAQPDVLKMNWHEFEWTFAEEAPTFSVLKERAAAVFRRHVLSALVITCGAEGILAFTPDSFYHARPPAIKAINATGAGDAASAVLAWRFSRGDKWPAALHHATAVSAAVVLTEATAECRQEDIERIYPQVVVDTFEVGDE